MNDLIIGTAGHVDHGKTALIEALTGYNGDEMAEEKARGITIDLSFSHMRRGGKTVAFIDVPGHERLIKTMVSGAFGFDAALLLVAADEGIMPQTLEHLAVLRLLGVRRIVGVLSRADRTDAAGLAKRRGELETLLQASEDLECLGIFATSIYDVQGIEALRKFLFALSPREREEGTFFRCYIDRVFSPKGVGTVVTGTVLSGRVSRGDKLNVSELGRPATVRNLQVHGEDVEAAHTHQRVAFNLDLNYNKLSKGMLLCTRGYFRGFERIDVSLTAADGYRWRHGEELLFISGAKRVEATLLLYEGEAFGTLKLRQKVFTRFGDPFVLLSGGRLAGGGEILIPISEPIRKRQKVSLLQALRSREWVRVFTLLLSHHRRGFGLISSEQRFAMSQEEALEIARKIPAAFVDEAAKVLYPPEALVRVEEALRRIYTDNPRALLSPASVGLRISWASEALTAAVMDGLESVGFLKKRRGLYLRADQSETELIEGLEERIYTILQEEGWTPEAPYDLYDRLALDRRTGDAALKALTRRKKVIRLAHNLFVTEPNLRAVLARMHEIMIAHGSIDVRRFKAETGMSRKYCIAYLEYLDRSGEVIREGDRRMQKYGG